MATKQYREGVKYYPYNKGGGGGGGGVLAMLTAGWGGGGGSTTSIGIVLTRDRA